MRSTRYASAGSTLFFLIGNKIFYSGTYLSHTTNGVSYTGISNVSSIVSCGDTIYYQTNHGVHSLNTTTNEKNFYMSHGQLIGAGYGILVHKVSKNNYLVSDLDSGGACEPINRMQIKCNSLGDIVCYNTNYVKIYNTRINKIYSLDTFTHHIASICISNVNLCVINTSGDICLYRLNDNHFYTRTQRVIENIDCTDITNTTRLTKLYVYKNSYVAIIRGVLVANINGRYREFPDCSSNITIADGDAPMIIASEMVIQTFIKDDYKGIELCSVSIAHC